MAAAGALKGKPKARTESVEVRCRRTELRTKRMREKREAAAGNAIPVQRGAGMAPAASEALPVSIAQAIFAPPSFCLGLIV